MIRAITIFVYMFLFSPIVVTIALAFNASEFGGFPFTAFSLRWFHVLFTNDRLLTSLLNSSILAISSAAISTLIGLFASLAIVRYRLKGGAYFSAMLLLPVLIPEVVIAVGLLLLVFMLGLRMNFAILLVGHVIITLPYVALLVQSNIVSLKMSVEEAALSLGAPPVSVFRRITFPLLMPSIVAGFLLSATISFDNITATLFWRPGGFETLPTQIYSMLRNSVTPELNAIATIMILVTALIPVAVAAIINISKREN